MKRYIPENAKEITKGDLNAVAYTYENTNGALYALAYSGRRNKPDFHYRYSNEQKREEAISNFFKRIETNSQYKKELKARQKELRGEFLEKIQIGSLFATSWGYEQTNVEWYQVTNVKGCSVYLRQIAADITPNGYMSGDSKPVKDTFIGEEFKRIVRGASIRIDEVVNAYPSDGSSRHCTSYG